MAATAATTKATNKHCYIGQKLISSGSLYQIVTPPKGGKHVKLAKALFESGIYSYWYTELGKIQYSTRVQDRAKVKGPTKIIYEFEETIMSSEKLEPLKLEGRIKTVFFSVAVNFILSYLCFTLEHLFEYLNSSWKIWRNDIKQLYCNCSNTKVKVFNFASKFKTNLLNYFVIMHAFCTVNVKRQSLILLTN